MMTACLLLNYATYNALWKSDYRETDPSCPALPYYNHWILSRGGHSQIYMSCSTTLLRGAPIAPHSSKQFNLRRSIISSSFNLCWGAVGRHRRHSIHNTHSWTESHLRRFRSSTFGMEVVVGSTGVRVEVVRDELSLEDIARSKASASYGRDVRL